LFSNTPSQNSLFSNNTLILLETTMGSNYSKVTVNPPAEINEKQMIVERHDAPKSDKPSVEVEQALSSDNITRWTNELEDVGSVQSLIV